MKKAIYILVPISIIIFMISIVIYKNFIPNDIMSDNKSKKIMTTNTISMMYETRANSGIYEANKNDKWPTSGYIFNETLSKCENGSELSWDDSTKKVIMTGSVSDKCYVYFDKEVITIANYIKGLYTTQGANNLYHHDGTLENGVDDGSYRYSGAYEEVNNWVCFGSDERICPIDNLYRIIGLFNSNIKLIKAYEGNEISLGKKTDALAMNSSYYSNYRGQYKENKNNIPGYFWSGSSSNESNIWTSSTLNTDILNGSFLVLLGDAWSEKIATIDWKMGKLSSFIPKDIFDEEITNAIDITKEKVGLMYFSDYAYAASSKYWSLYTFHPYDSDYGSAIGENWLYLGVHEATISAQKGSSSNCEIIGCDGISSSTNVTNPIVIRPAFYLNSNVTYASGTGTQSDPFRIS